MALPKVLLAVPLLLAGMYLPAWGSEPPPAPDGVLGMTHLFYDRDEVSVKCGDTLPMVNNSRWSHIIGPGHDGLLVDAPRGVPVTERTLLETDDTFTTGKWEVPGRYDLTCSVHPDMNVRVVVTDCCC